MTASAKLSQIATSVNEQDDRIKAIPGLCEVAAEGGHFLCRFDRSEYLISDFDAMRAEGCTVEWDFGTIYVRWN